MVDRFRTIACFFPADYPTYNISSEVREEECGFSVRAKRSPGAYSVIPKPVEEVNLAVRYETSSRVRIRITDPNAQRWEPPIELGSPDPVCPKNRRYEVHLEGPRLGFGVSRVEHTNGERVNLLNSTGLMASAFVFADQYLQIAFKVRAVHGYGLGEREDSFPMDMHEWKRMTYWARDDVPRRDANLYGIQNFFLGIASDGTAFGFFFLNSNAFEVMKQPLPSLAFRTIGGILDFFVFVGPSPTEVVAQYYALIGYPPVPPYWALGYQLCRYGYTGIEEIRNTIDRNREAGIPQDVQWFDIDYMDQMRDWTLSKKEDYKGLGEFVSKELKEKRGLRVVAIVDPAIPIEAGDDYLPYKTGVDADVFVKDSRTGQPLVGSVWPGKTVFPDFTKNATFDWWYQCASDFHKKFEFDGLWIDMNEPSNFNDGSLIGCDHENSLDFPPYTPNVVGGRLFSRTICPSALHDKGVPHYNLHNMYALDEARVTHEAMRRIVPGKRPFLLTRSSFSGSGRYTNHWTGDVTSTWEAMATSIPQMINFNLFGMPMIGADICGFVDSTVEELCVRWSQLGAFYPFSRNHNSLGSRLQDPASWSLAAQKAIAKALGMRYQILPYLYTQLYESRFLGTMTVRALAFDYPKDLSTHHNARQFLLGSCLNVAPVLAEGMTFTPVYLPEGEWVEFSDLKRYKSTGKTFPIPAPLDKIPVFFRGGCILPMHPPGAMNTVEARKMGLGVTVVLSKIDNGTAAGELAWDDGESEDGPILLVSFNLTSQRLTSQANVYIGKTEDFKEAAPLSFIRIIGVSRKPANVKLDGISLEFGFDASTQMINVTKFPNPINLRDNWELIWK